MQLTVLFLGCGTCSVEAGGDELAARTTDGMEEMDQDPGNKGKEEDIMTRARRYLNKKKSESTQSLAGDDKPTVSDILNPGIASTYSAILRNKNQSLQVPNLDGVGQAQLDDIGTFFNKGDYRMANAHFRTNLSKNLNVSFSFNPSNFTCNNCGGGLRSCWGAGKWGDPNAVCVPAV